MINNIGTTSHSSQYIRVHTTGSGGGLYISPGAQSAGMMRFNTSSNQIEVYDGVAWHPIATQVTVDLTQRTIDIFHWAERQMEDDARIRKLIQENPTVADAFKSYQEAADKLKVVVALVEQGQK